MKTLNGVRVKANKPVYVLWRRGLVRGMLYITNGIDLNCKLLFKLTLVYEYLVVEHMWILCGTYLLMHIFVSKLIFKFFLFKYPNI